MRKTMRKAFILALLLVSFFVVSCDQQQSFLINPHQGSEGVTIEFLPDMPPAAVYEGAFYLGLKLTNKGASEIKREQGFLSLALETDYLGFSAEDVQVDDQHAAFDSAERAKFNLIGKTKYDPVGEDTLVTLQLRTKPLDPQLETLTTNILATICYEYETQATANICIDTDPTNMHMTEKVCQMHDTSLTDQGAPIAVTNVQQTLLTGIGGYVQPQFIITVRNAGNGQPLKANTAEQACGSGPFSQQALAVQPKRALDTIKLKDLSFAGFSLANGQFECSPAANDGIFFALENGVGTIKCTLKGGLLKQSQESFLTNLFIVLDYAFTTTASRQVQIKRG